jgi:S-formylglutathione hydrolase
MNRNQVVLLMILVAAGFAAAPVAASELVGAEVESEIVPSPVEYYALLPPGYADASEPLPLVLNLHGGGGNRDVLKRQVPIFEGMWEKGELPPMVIVTPSVTARGFYMDYRDGSEKWESFIVGPFLKHLRATYKVSSDSKKTFITGISMGGMGSLRIALKHPELFGAVAGQEPGIEPILNWHEMRPKHRYWRADSLFERAYGKPVDPEYWAANNPATIVTTNAARLRESGLKIYLETGDMDEFWLYEGTEFLHQVLWDRRVRHEYHLVHGAGHIDASLGDRTREAYLFLARSMGPYGAETLSDTAKKRLELIMRPQAKLDEKDHYSHPEAEPRITTGW